MKKLFICVMTSLCSTFAFADADLVVKPATITNGSGTMQVVINKTNTTAFQFDVKLPAGISVATENGFSLTGAPTSRKFEKAKVDATTNTWRFLTYDDGNATFADGTTFDITLAAETSAVEGQAETGAIVLVDPNGNSTEANNGPSTTIGVTTKISITSEAKKMTTFVSKTGLDFTDSDAKAYVVTGVEGNSVWMTRVYKVPAGTAIAVKGSVGDHNVKTVDVKGIYYKNFLIGNNTDEKVSVTPEGDDNYYFFGADNGFTPFTAARNIGAHKAYLRVSKLPEEVPGSDVEIEIKDKVTSLCANVDLDFANRTDGVKAYVATGFDGSVWLTPVETASAGTPLYIKGPKGKYTIPSKGTQTVYANMMKGNNTNEKITISPTEGEYTNYFVSSTGFNSFTADRQVSPGKSYLQIITSYLPAASRGISDGSIVIGETETETLSVSLGSLEGNNDNTTNIRSIDDQLTNDTWYNLNGQRIDTPTKKGLYIKNGKKVIVR